MFSPTRCSLRLQWNSSNIARRRRPVWIRLLRTARTEHIRYKRFSTETCMSERAVFYRNAARFSYHGGLRFHEGKIMVALVIICVQVLSFRPFLV